MSTLADELLNDFEDSGSEEDDGHENGFLQEGASSPATNGEAHKRSMILDGDEEEVDEDEEMNGVTGSHAVADVEDEEEAKAKVEKMQLGSVSDVRTVAGLMKTLEPVLQVCTLFPPPGIYKQAQVYIFGHSPDVIRPSENRTLPEPTTNTTNYIHRLDRRQPRIPSPRSIKHPFYIYRQRNHTRPQVYP